MVSLQTELKILLESRKLLFPLLSPTCLDVLPDDERIMNQ